MLKVLVHDANGRVVILGLTPSNIRELQAGNPIKVDCRQLGIRGITVVVMAGETRDAMVDELVQGNVLSQGQATMYKNIDTGEGN